MTKFVKNWLPVFLWAGLIFFLSAQPDLKLEAAGGFDFFLRKGAHMAEFGVLFLLLYRAVANKKSPLTPPRIKYGAGSKGGELPPFREGWGGFKSKKALIFAFVISVLYAISDEYHQSFVFGRVASLMDIGIDAIGILLVIYFVARR